MQAGTIVASNYLAMAQILGESFLEHHPDSTFSVLVVDDGIADLPDGIEVVRLADLDIPARDERMMRTVYDVMEFSTAVKPSFLRHLLAAGGGAACYLDPDIEVFAPFGSQVDAALDHGIVLTPHVLAPVPRDGLRIDEETIMQSGMYNCGFLAVGPTARPFLDWWDERLRFDALVDFGRARFTDQRWVDWVPSLFDFVIDRDPGMNVAWWNIHDRPIDLDPSGSRTAATVQGRPLRFVHFSGYDPQLPDLLSKHQLPNPRIDHAVGTGIRTLSDAYGARLVALGHIERRRGAYPWNRSHDGVELSTALRRLVRDAALLDIEHHGAVRSVPDAFDPELDFAGWIAARAAVAPTRTSTSTARSSGIEIFRVVPDHEPAGVPEAGARTSPDREQRRAYDVEFDWNDAHGHAVRLLLDGCRPGIVVDLGCGYAPHAEVLREAGFQFVGLDLDHASLERVAGRGFVARRADLALTHEVEEILTQTLAEVLAGRSDDADLVAVMALDVLEHLVAPERLLAMLADWMRPHHDAVLVTSVPNVAHRDIAAKLLAGRWDVTPTGLLDHTHLRFFTDSSITGVMASAGFTEAMRNDRIAPRSDQRWPVGDPITSPHTPLASMVGAIRDTFDVHGDTYQLIRGYRVGERAAPDVPTLMVADPTRPSIALSVIAVPGTDDDELAVLRTQLESQSNTLWELLAAPSSGDRPDDPSASLDALVAAASGAYVAFVERGEEIASGWVQQFVDVMMVTVPGGAPDGDVGGHVLRCTAPNHDLEARPASAVLAFPTAAVRSLAPAFDDRGHQAMSLRAHLVLLCGEVETDVPAVVSLGDVAGDAWTFESAARSAATARAVTSPPGSVESLQAEVDRLRVEVGRLTQHRDDLVGDNEWLNDELSSLPVRLVRRALRRGASRADTATRGRHGDR